MSLFRYGACYLDIILPVDVSSFGNTGNFGPVVTPKTSPSNSGHTLDLLGLSKTVGPMSPTQSMFLDGSVPATLQ